MNKGVEILLARMETNPEEFENTGRWIDLYNQFKKYMSEEEQNAVMNKLKELKMAQFEQAVVKRLLNDEQQFLTKIDMKKILETGIDECFNEAYAEYTRGLSDEFGN
jgi:hypothetical protein